MTWAKLVGTLLASAALCSAFGQQTSTANSAGGPSSQSTASPAPATPPQSAGPGGGPAAGGGPVRAACMADVKKLCAEVPPGHGRVLSCLREHKDEVSAACKQALSKARQPL